MCQARGKNILLIFALISHPVWGGDRHERRKCTNKFVITAAVEVLIMCLTRGPNLVRMTGETPLAGNSAAKSSTMRRI